MTEVLVVDMQAVLDDSQVGRYAAWELSQRWESARAEAVELHERMRAGGFAEAQEAADAQLRQHEEESIQELEAMRERLRDSLLERARGVVLEIAQARGATVVVDRSAAIFVAPEQDISREVISGVDALGALM